MRALLDQGLQVIGLHLVEVRKRHDNLIRVGRASAAVALLFDANISALTSVAIACVIDEPLSLAKAVTSLISAVAVA